MLPKSVIFHHPTSEFLIVAHTSRTIGRGLYARSPIPAGTAFHDVRGRRYDWPDCAASPNEGIAHDGVPIKAIQVATTVWILDALLEWLNHSCAPNAWVRIDAERAWLVAITDIAAGEHVTIDYSVTMWADGWELACSCGDASCRKRIGDFATLPASVKQHCRALGIVPAYQLDSDPQTT